MSASQQRPQLRVVRGDATAEEIAALLAAVASRSTWRHGPAPSTGWASRSHGLRAPLHPGPGAWRASAFPT